MKPSILALACFGFLLTSSAHAVTNNYYVSTTGNDSNNGLTSGTAWRTITHAASAISVGASGTIVHVAPGTYTENVTISTSHPGTATQPVTYQSDTKWGAHIVGTSTAQSSSVFLNYGAYTTIKDFEISGTNCGGVLNESTHQTVIGNNVHNYAQGCSGLQGGNGGGGIANAYGGNGLNNNVFNNFVHDVGFDPGHVNTYCWDGTDLSIHGIYHQVTGTIANNLVVHNCGIGIELFHRATNTIIVNNTVVGNKDGIQVGAGGGGCSSSSPCTLSNVKVYNNIAANNSRSGQNSAGFLENCTSSSNCIDGGGNQFSYDLGYGSTYNFDPYQQPVTCSPGCLQVDPKFVNSTGTAAGDYHLQSTSPTIGAGTTTYAPATDYDGITRTAPITIGAYQGQGTVSVSSAPIGYWKLDDGSGSLAFDSSGKNLTMSLFNSPAWQSHQNCALNGCLSFNGTNQYGSVSLDLSSTNVVTIAFWMKWNVYQNDDKLAFEFSGNFNKSTTGFMIDPDESSSGQFWVSLHGNGGYNNADFPRPSAGVWHHYAFVLNKGAATASEVTPYVDGTAISYTKSTYATDNTNSFGNNTLYVMSRSGASLFGAGSLDEVRIYPTALSSSQIATLATR